LISSIAITMSQKCAQMKISQGMDEFTVVFL
jgi:hypothetical protein